MHIQLTIRRAASATGYDNREPGSRLRQLKSALIAFLSLSVVIGVFLAAFALGSVFAILLVLIAVLFLIASLARSLFKKVRQNEGKVDSSGFQNDELTKTGSPRP